MQFLVVGIKSTYEDPSESTPGIFTTSPTVGFSDDDDGGDNGGTPMLLLGNGIAPAGPTFSAKATNGTAAGETATLSVSRALLRTGDVALSMATEAAGDMAGLPLEVESPGPSALRGIDASEHHMSTDDASSGTADTAHTIRQPKLTAT
jgi:hypothetical protein